MSRIGRWLSRTGLVVLLAPARFALATPAPVGTPLAVPFLAQGELLCGGAAVAMVERWWGRRGVYAEDFADLVQPTRGGILTTDLADAARQRGYAVRTLVGGRAAVTQALADSVPVIALIRVGADRYHYVVITDWRDDQVRYHDPAIGPDRRADPARFLEQWRAADGWMMVMVPGPAAPVTPPPTVPGAEAAAGRPCQPWLTDAGASASLGALDRADSLLARARVECPEVAEVRRELAGLRFRQGRRTEAESLAIRYLIEQPHDTLARQLVATTRYLDGDRRGALLAWNAIGRPRLDLVRIDGSRRIRYRVLERAVAIPPGSILRADALALARRRLQAVPGLSAARLDYAAVAGGEVELRANIAEHPVVPPWPSLVLGNVASAIGRHELGAMIGSVSGAGERWQVAWHWERADPSVGIRLDVPVRIGSPGVVSVRGARERWRIDGVADVARRHAVELGWSSWLMPSLRGRVATRYERWGNGDRQFAATGGVTLRMFDDRFTVEAIAEAAVPLRGESGYRRTSLRGRWDAGSALGGARWSLRLGREWASGTTPTPLLPHAGGDLGRPVPLRAHAWSEDGHLPDSRLAHAMIHAGASVDRSLFTAGLLIVGIGGFADFAHGSATARPATWLDAGLGTTISVVGESVAGIRVDVARGLLDQPGWGLRVGVTSRLAGPLAIE